MQDRRLRAKSEKIVFLRKIKTRLEDLIINMDEQSGFVRLSDEEIFAIRKPINRSLNYIEKVFQEKGVE